MNQDLMLELHVMENLICLCKLLALFQLKSYLQENKLVFLFPVLQFGYSFSSGQLLNISRMFRRTCSLTGMLKPFQLLIIQLSSELNLKCMMSSKIIILTPITLWQKFHSLDYMSKMNWKNV